MNDWSNLDYLQNGTPRQFAAFRCLHRLGILQELKEYRPVLVSTICIGIDIESSDLDIICQISEPIKFTRQITTLYGERPNFNLFEVCAENNSVVAEFEFENFMIEVFGQPVVVEKQAAYRHLSVMARLLSAGGKAMRESIRELKRQGLKSEPAFAKYLGLSGDPYQVLLELESISDDQLVEIVANNITGNRNVNRTLKTG
ncbi:MAG: DUF4269 domain-containing protein [Acidobacteriota bacterium]|nr:DUF4269 domain-containing protein [Acidobacteriota bacterium]